MIEIKIEKETISVAECLQKAAVRECGGINLFVGTVRSHTNGKKVEALFFEAYEKMALKELRKIAEDSIKNWPVQTIVIRHRVGTLLVGDIPVVIAVGAAHRSAAFEACQYIIDTLKQTVPIWKKEIFRDGEVWVAAHP
ncbi:MAG: molybdenum cofactor biosynthesis protein MoaE [Chitinophagaceae bacterium]